MTLRGDEVHAGYAHAEYAASFADVGSPCRLPHSGGWIIKRQIPGTTDFDGMGCYPIFACDNWSGLCSDLEALESQLVAISLVTDPFGDYDEVYLRKCFKHVVRPYKPHFIVDLERDAKTFVSSHHQKEARRALRKIDVTVVANPAAFVMEWDSLYQVLAKRHEISGLRAFSVRAFSRLLSIEGAVVMCGRSKGELVGAQIYLRTGTAVYCHLGAFSELGYRQGVSYALDWASIEHFAGRAKWLDLGGGVGAVHPGCDGLSLYKRGWASDIRPVYLCGSILDERKYRDLAACVERRPGEYFPAYRAGEFL